MDNELFDCSMQVTGHQTCRLLFKEEDRDDKGIPIGPLYLLADGHSLSSKRYVTIVEAMHLSETLNADLEAI